MSDDEFIPELEKQFKEEIKKLDKAETISDFKNVLFRLFQGKQNLSIGMMDLNLRIEDIQEDLSKIKDHLGI